MENKKTGVELIAAERQRQIEVEGWTAEHDAGHERGELARAAAVYAWPGQYIHTGPPRNAIITKGELWPFDYLSFKPASNGDHLPDLIKAGALIAAEIDRLQNTNQ